MTQSTETRYPSLRLLFEQAEQGHVFHFFDTLSSAQRTRLIDQLEEVDLDLLSRLVLEMRRDDPIATLDLGRLAPPTVISIPRDDASKAKQKEAIEQGTQLLRAGKVAAFVVAGGQGTRLGFDGPKGCFPVGPVSGCSLFEWHFAKVVASRRRYQANIPILVMTSLANHAETERFLHDNNHFGMPKEDVLLFTQGMLPAVDSEGKILLSSVDSIALAPDGHGGSLLALARRGILDELDRRGIEELFYFQVDNPMVRVLDPAFLGYHQLHQSDMSSKVVAKRDAAEKVGVFARVDDQVGIVEYSDLPDELAQAREPDGELRFRAGNIAIHVISTRFVRELTSGGLSLPYHRASKAIPCVEPTASRVEPTEKLGVKFETFVFDALPQAKNALVVETSRADEFSPIKNKEGEDSAESARRDLCQQFRGWIESAGYGITDAMSDLEIAPTYALDGEEFQQRLAHQKLFPGGRLFMA